MSSTPPATDDVAYEARETVRTGAAPTMVDDTPDLAHRYADRFLEDRRLGQGGVGEVVRAMDLDIGRRVAIKRLRRDRREQADVARFIREIRLVGTLEHPNIVPLHDVGQDEHDEVYAVMKWVDGETLEDLITRLREGDRDAHQRFPFPVRARIFMDLCRAIAHAHSHGVLHRDIKPANVMIGRTGEVQVLDWGLAKLHDTSEPLAPSLEPRAAHETMEGAVFGTPIYMAPEQARGERYTEQSEIFALGVLFWELLTLQPLVPEGTTAQEAVELAKVRKLPWAMFRRAHPRQGAVPAPLSWFVDVAVQPDPGRRFDSVADMMEELRKRNAGLFRVQCPGTLQRRVLAEAGRAVDRAPMLTMMAAMGSMAATIGADVALGALLL